MTFTLLRLRCLDHTLVRGPVHPLPTKEGSSLGLVDMLAISVPGILWLWEEPCPSQNSMSF